MAIPYWWQSEEVVRGGAHNYIYKIQLLQNPLNQGSAPPLVYELHGGKKTYLAAN